MLLSLPLSAQLSYGVVQFARDFEQAGAGLQPVPCLVLWSNFLRCLGEDSVRVVDLSKRARLSRRAIATWLNPHWVEPAPGPAGRGEKRVRLSATGRAVKAAWGPLVQTVEAAWEKKFGKEQVGELRAALEGLVSQFDLELAHFPTGYGAVDDSITGGDHRPAKEGPPYIPPRGSDWSPVVREHGDTVSHVPLYALMSQAVQQFGLDYERYHAGSLALVGNVLRRVGDEPIPVEEFPDVLGIPGYERYGLVTVVPAPTQAEPKRRTVQLTEKARKARDLYPATTAAVEKAWAERYGKDVVKRLRAGLTPIVETLDAARLPHYPKVRFVPGVGFTEVSLGAPFSLN